MLSKINWTWLIIGILVAWFVIPFLTGRLAARKSAPTASRTA